jgi:hypothetical protein
VTDAVVFTVMFWKTIVTSLSAISTRFVVDDPVTKIVPMEIGLAALHVSVPPSTVIDAIATSQVIVEIR